MRKTVPKHVPINCNTCPLLIAAKKLLAYNENDKIVTKLKLFQIKNYNMN